MQDARDGTAAFSFMGATYQTYYKVYGDLEAKQTHQRLPLVVLHGGPRLTHDYLLPLIVLAGKHNIPIIFYDQLGNGRSSHITNQSTSFWSIGLFVEELDNLVRKLGIQDGFDLLGHSWGGVLAAEYEVRKQPSGLRRLVLSNSLASQQLWNQSNAELAKKFPLHVQEGLKARTSDVAGFWAMLKEYYAVHGCVVDSGREVFMKSIWEALMGPDGDPTVSNAYILRRWSIIDRLHRVRVPTLIINGRHDISQNFVIRPFLERIKSVQWVQFENSSHTPFLEEPEHYLTVVDNFLAQR